MKKLVVLLVMLSLCSTGCNEKQNQNNKVEPENAVNIKPVLAEKHRYWVQSYSTVYKEAEDIPDKPYRLYTQMSVEYFTQAITDNGVILDAKVNFLDLFIQNQQRIIDDSLRQLLIEGFTFQVSNKTEQLIALTPKNLKLHQQLLGNNNQRADYKYTRSTLIIPYFMANFPIHLGEKIELQNLLKMNNLSVSFNKASDDTIVLIITGTNTPKGQLYGKLVLDKHTGRILRLALVREMGLDDSPGYNIRSVILMGPEQWAIGADYQLDQLMGDSKNNPYTHSVNLVNFDETMWRSQRDKEINNHSKTGKVYTLISNAYNQLVLSYHNATGAQGYRFGEYNVTDLQLFDAKTQPLSLAVQPVYNEIKTLASSSDTALNVAVYKLREGDHEQFNRVTKATARLDFTPYDLQALDLPLSTDRRRLVETDGFMADITPTNNPNAFILHWKNSDDTQFNTSLIAGTEGKVILQYIQPSAKGWLSPNEFNVVDRIAEGHEHYVHIVFEDKVPSVLTLYPMRKQAAPAFQYSVEFQRNTP